MSYVIEYNCLYHATHPLLLLMLSGKISITVKILNSLYYTSDKEQYNRI